MQKKTALASKNLDIWKLYLSITTAYMAFIKA